MSTYCTRIDFDAFKSDFLTIAGKNNEKNQLNDLSDIPDDVIAFFRALLFADSMEVLNEFSDQVLSQSEQFLQGTDTLFSYLLNLEDNDSLLANPQLAYEISSRRMKRRRLL